MTLIYGYDEDNEDFYIADNNNYGKYDFCSINLKMLQMRLRL